MVLICLRYCELKFPWTFYAYSTFLVFKMYFFRNKQDEIFSTNAIYKQDVAQNTVKYFKKEFKQCLTIKSLIGRNNGEMWHHMWLGKKRCGVPSLPPHPLYPEAVQGGQEVDDPPFWKRRIVKSIFWLHFSGD